MTDQLNIGWTAQYPSSTVLFMDWYRNLTGAVASYQTVFTWGAFDIVESALYRAAINAPEGAETISPSYVLALLEGSQVRSPAGQVAFDSNGVYTTVQSIFVQVLPTSSTSEIVAPSEQQTAFLVYPMPSWEDRIYEWSLIKLSVERAGVSIAAISTLILITIIVTVCVHRRGA